MEKGFRKMWELELYALKGTATDLRFTYSQAHNALAVLSCESEILGGF